MSAHKTIPYTFILLWLFPVFGYSQIDKNPVNRPNIIKYDVLGAATGNATLNVAYERFLFKRALSVEIGIAQLSTGSLGNLPKPGLSNETDTEVGICGDTRRASWYYSQEYDCKGITFKVGPKIFPFNFGNKWQRFLKRGLYIQPDFYLNLYKTDYFYQENELISCTELVLIFFNEAEYEVNTTFFEKESAHSLIAQANLGYQYTHWSGIHIDVSVGLGTPLMYSNPSKSSSFQNLISQIELGYAF